MITGTAVTHAFNWTALETNEHSKDSDQAWPFLLAIELALVFYLLLLPHVLAVSNLLPSGFLLSWPIWNWNDMING